MFWLLGPMLLVSVGYGLFELGRYRAGFDLLGAREQSDEQEAAIRRLKKENEGLSQRIALLETGHDVDKEAYRQVESRLTELQAKIMEQQEDLAFYKGIIAPEDGVAGLRVQEFQLLPMTESNSFRFRLVLVQAKQHDRRVSGVVDFSVDGAEDGRTVSYGLAKLAPKLEGNGELAFSFRYFQDFEHNLLLPEGFTPERVHIEVRPKGRSARTLRKTYDWPLTDS